MAQNRIQRFGPVALANVATDVLNPADAGAGQVGYVPTASYIILRHIRIVNKTGGAVSFSGWLGATGASAAGTEVIGTGKVIAANDAYDWYGMLRLDTADFLVMLASAAASLTFEAEGEVGLV